MLGLCCALFYYGKSLKLLSNFDVIKNLNFFQFIIIYGLINYEPLKYDEYLYPTWANVVGWGIAASSVLCIPGMAIWQLFITPGTLKEASNQNYTVKPFYNEQIGAAKSVR